MNGRDGSEIKETSKNAGALFLFDMDETISSKHINGSIYAAEDALGRDLTDEEQWAVASTIEPRGGAAAWRNLFAELIEDGHQIGIISFCVYPKVALRYLKEKLELPEQIFNQIFVACHREYGENDKNNHIDEAITHFKRDASDVNIALVEDSKDIIKAAIDAGKIRKDRTILVPKEEKDIAPEDRAKAAADEDYLATYITSPHIDQTRALSKQLKKEIAEQRAAASAPEKEHKSFYNTGFNTFKTPEPAENPAAYEEKRKDSNTPSL